MKSVIFIEIVELLSKNKQQWLSYKTTFSSECSVVFTPDGSVVANSDYSEGLDLYQS